MKHQVNPTRKWLWFYECPDSDWRSIRWQNFTYFSACATGEFSVLWSPNPIVFKGDEKLNSAYLSDVYAASLGRSVSGFTQWSGLYISDPFNLPKSAVTIVVNGETHLKLSDKVKTFKLSGSDAGESLNALTSIMNVVDIDLSQDVSQVWPKLRLFVLSFIVFFTAWSVCWSVWRSGYIEHSKRNFRFEATTTFRGQVIPPTNCCH